MVVQPPVNKTVVLQRYPLEFMCRASKAIETCEIKIHNIPLSIELDDKHKSKVYDYLGAGFGRGECGIRWHKAQKAPLDQSGNFSCHVKFPDNDGVFSAQAEIMVVERPRNAILQSSNPDFQFKENETMQFYCMAGADDSKPDEINSTIFLGMNLRD